jgi:hypothetical protein
VSCVHMCTVFRVATCREESGRTPIMYACLIVRITELLSLLGQFDVKP